MSWPALKTGTLLLGCLLCLVLATPAQANLIITGETATVTPGGTGTVDFMISSSSGSSYTIDSFSLELLITTKSGNSLLQFTTTNGTIDFAAQSNYVFGNNGSGVPYWGPPMTTNTTFDTITGGDFASPGTMITSSSSFLLAEVQFQADASASLGDSFSISLVPSQETQSGYPPNTSTAFFDENGASIAFNSFSAEVTVTPEPATLALAGIAGLTGAIYSWKRRRKGAAS